MSEAPVKQMAAVQHEHFCLPRPDAQEPRMEGFVAYRDDVDGKSIPTANVTRCLECGATRYDPI